MAKIRQLFVGVFGNVSWQPPAWVGGAAGHRRAVAAGLLAVALAAGGSWRAWQWYKNLPQPRTVSVHAEPLPVTHLEEKLHFPKLRVVFTGSVAPLERIGKAVTSGIAIEPKAAGAWRWEEDRALVFTPVSDWPADTKYTVTLEKDVVAGHILLDHYTVQVRTPPFAGNIKKLAFYQDPKDPALKQVVATLEFSHSLAQGALENALSLKVLGASPVLKEGVPPFTVDYGLHRRIAYVHSAPMTLPEREDFMKLTVDKSLRTSQGGAATHATLEGKTRIPDRFSFFKIADTEGKIALDDKGDPEQTLTIVTTADVSAAELAKSLEIFLLPPKTADDDDEKDGDDAKEGNDDAAAIAAGGGAAARKVKGDDDDDDAAPKAQKGDAEENDDMGEQSDKVDENDPGAATEAMAERETNRNDSDDEDTETVDRHSTEEKKAPKWKSASEVDEDDLKEAKPVKFTVVPSDEEDASENLIVKFKVETAGSLYVRVRKGVRALGGFQLKADYCKVLDVPLPPPSVEIQGEGGLLALSGERKLSIRSRGVPVIEYTIARIPAAEINHLISQTGGDLDKFESPSFSASFDENDMARISIEKQPINVLPGFKANYSTFDFSTHLSPATDGGSPLQGLFILDADAWNPKTKEYMNGVAARRLILVTDIGILVKENANKSRDVFLQSLKSRSALPNVPVSVLGRNGVAVLTGTTNADGRVTFPALGDPAPEKKPVAIVARNGQDVGFIPYNRNDRKLDFSRFEVSGIESVSGAELTAFVFTERGVYRPGDEMHVAFSVKQRNWGGNLEGLPVQAEVLDARGLRVQVKNMTLPATGFMEFGFQTAPESPTGDYTLNVFLLRDGTRRILLGSGSALVKEFLPDRMKLQSHLSTEITEGWIVPKGVKASLALSNLYGTPATGRRISSHMRLSPTGFRFDAYKDYSFYDRLLEANADIDSETVELGDNTTDDKGAAEVDLDLERFAKATYRMTFYAEGFEASGGRSVNTDKSVMISALPYVVGYKTDASLNYVKMNSECAVDFVAVDNTLKRSPLENLKMKLIEHTFVSILKKQEDGTYAYDSVEKDRVALTGTLSIPAEGLKYMLPTTAPGNFTLELADQTGWNVSKLPYSVVGLGPVSRALDRNAELEVKLDRKFYNSGDEVEVSIRAPYTGSGLITIERDKVYAQQWFKASQTASVQHIKVPEGFDGTGYVNVSFIRAPDSREIYMSPLSYAVVPFTANRERRKLKLDLHAAGHARPGEPLTISYSANRPTKIVVFAVDKGILQVTGFETPDPLEFYFRKSALMVKTSQIVDLIIPEFSVLRAAAFGGDADKRLNPFKRVTEKPVVFWSGIVDADTTARQVVYNVPDYFDGTLTVMAVAVSGDAVGSVDQESVIRSPFVITPGVPTLAAPGDRFEVGVTVADGLTPEGAQTDDVTLAVQPSEHLEVVKAPPMPLHIVRGRETTATFTVLAKDKLGSASLLFKASGGGEEATRRSTLSVRPATPFMTQVRGGNFTSAAAELPVTRAMHPEYRKLEAVVSSVPLGLAHGLDVYLKNYPNGCSEQLTSGAFCRLMIAGDADFGLPRAEIYAQLEKTFGVLRRRQNDQGGFGYWGPEKNDGVDFITTYVMHFLVEAKDAGFAPPADMFQAGLRDLQKMVVKEPGNLEEARTLAYAIYLLTREEVITTNYILNLRDYLDTHFKGKWENDLTGVYLAGSLSLLKKSDEALPLVKAYRIGVHHDRERFDFYSPLGEDSQYVAVTARHFPEILKRLTAPEFEAILRPIGEGDFNTLSAAYAVAALKSYSQLMASNPPALGIQEKTKEGRPTNLSAAGRLLKRVDFSPKAASLRFTANPPIRGLGAFYQVIEAGFDSGLADKPVASGLEVHREFVDAHGNVTNEAKLGVPLKVRIRIRSLKDASISHVAIVDLLPGGFEVVASSLRPGVGSCGCDYVDVREDRALFYTTVGTGVREIDYQIKPDNRGEFVVPPVFAESMYERGINSRGVSGRMSVTEP